jgi:hypothetical protein
MPGTAAGIQCTASQQAELAVRDGPIRLILVMVHSKEEAMQSDISGTEEPPGELLFLSPDVHIIMIDPFVFAILRSSVLYTRHYNNTLPFYRRFL